MVVADTAGKWPLREDVTSDFIYVRLHGELSVLGLISASLTFNLQLAYLKENGHSVVWGEATLEVILGILESARTGRDVAMTHQAPARVPSID